MEMIASLPTGSRSHIKRPMNSFMVWSREKRCEILKKHPGINNAVVSKTLGAAWKNLTEEEKKPYVFKAQKLAEQHRDEHPEYKYRPRRRKSRMKAIDTQEVMASNGPPMHIPPPSHCMCHVNSPSPSYPSLPRCPPPQRQYPYPPYYNVAPPPCCSRERVKTGFQELIEQQDLMRMKEVHYSHEMEMRYKGAFKPTCTRGCCSPTDEHLRYYRYPSYTKETIPYSN